MKNEIAVVLNEMRTDLRLSVLSNLLCSAAVASESCAEQGRAGQGRVKVPEDATPTCSAKRAFMIHCPNNSYSNACNAESICTLHRYPSEVLGWDKENLTRMRHRLVMSVCIKSYCEIFPHPQT